MDTSYAFKTLVPPHGRFAAKTPAALHRQHQGLLHGDFLEIGTRTIRCQNKLRKAYIILHTTNFKPEMPLLREVRGVQQGSRNHLRPRLAFQALVVGLRT